MRQSVSDRFLPYPFQESPLSHARFSSVPVDLAISQHEAEEEEAEETPGAANLREADDAASQVTDGDAMLRELQSFLVVTVNGLLSRWLPSLPG
jgi:hypothetical protein